MASLVDFYKQKLAPVGQRLSEVFRPQTGTLATAGRQAYQKLAATPLTQTQQKIAEIPIGAMKGVTNALGGFTGIQNKIAPKLGLGTFTNIQPQYAPGKISEVVGNIGGSLIPAAPVNQLAKLIKPVGAVRTAQKYLGSQAGKLIAQKGLTGLGGKALANVSQGIPFTAGFALAQKIGGQEYGGKQLAGDVGFDVAAGALIPGAAAAIPLLAGITKNKANLSKFLDKEPLVKALSIRASRLDKMLPAGWMETKEMFQKSAQELVPDILKNKEIIQLEKTNPDQWMKMIASVIEDRFVAAKTGDYSLAGLSTKAMGKLETPKLSVEPTTSIDKVSQSAAKYGWTAKQGEKGIELTSQNGKATILITEKKNGQYKFAWPDGEKLMDGRGQIGKSTENLIEKMFYGKQLEPSKPLSVEPVVGRLDAILAHYKQFPNGVDIEAVKGEFGNNPQALKAIEQAQKEIKVSAANTKIQAQKEAEVARKMSNAETVGELRAAEAEMNQLRSPSPLGGEVEPKTVTPIRKPLKEVYKEQLTPETRVEPQVQSPELQRINTQIEAPKPVVSSDSIITPAGNLPKQSRVLKQQLAEAQQGLEQSQVVAEQNKLIRDNFSPDQIKEINQLKMLAKKSLDQGGDIETLRGKYPKLVESVTSSVREADQTITGDSEALDFALSLPTKAETKVNMTEVRQLQKQLDPITKLDEAGVAATTGDKSVTSAVVEPTTKTVKGITTKQQKLDTANEVRARKKLDDEWQKAVFGEAQTRTVKQAEKELEKAIKTSTNEATFKLDTADSWKDKNALSLGTETMDRNFEDIMGKQAPELKKKLLEPVYKSEAQRTKFLNTEREQIKKLGIKAGSKESSLVQEYGEGNITSEQLKQQTNNPDKIIKASEFIRGKYDTYLGQLNKVLTRNGYEPIPKRSDYFHHFQELSGAFDLLGVSLKAQDLPTDINGLTADFKPGKTFFSAALRRLGGEYKSDAIGGIDKYLEGASNQIYHTDNIQALRSFETALREKYAGTQHLSNFVANLSEYTNGIAGKKSMIDRAAESIVGRGIYGAATGLKRQVGANMVGANVSSALTNFIPLTQTLATTDKGSVLNAIMATIKNVGKDDGFIQASDFLTTRHGTDRLAKSLYENVADKAGWLFKNVDSFVSQVVTRSKYLEGIKKGMSEADAMSRANSWAKKLMAGRGKGEMPTLFNSQTLGAITQFQLEIKNQLSFMAKDIPRNFDKVGAASAIAQLFLYGYLFNNIYEKITGRRPAFDPIGVGQRTYEDYTNPNMKKGQATKNLVSNVSNQLPFVSTFTGGRLPITSAIPNPMAVVNGESTLKKELLKPVQFVLPTGGGQIKKSLEGISAYNKGVSTSPSGRVRFTIPQTPVNRVKTALFGQWSTPEAQKYLREGQSPLGENQSKIILESNDKQTLFDKIKARQLSDKQLTAVKDTLKSGNTKSAAVTTGKYVYFDDKTGDVNTLDLSKVSSMPSSTNYEQVKKETEKWKVADDILKLDHTDQVEAFKQLGISKDDAQYYIVAKDTVEAKAAYIKDQVQGVKNYDEFLQKVAPLTREVNGEKILSDGVVDWMYNNDIITSAQKKQLKALEYDNIKKVARVSAKKGSTKAKKITVKKLGKFNLAGKVKKVKRIRTKVYKLKI